MNNHHLKSLDNYEWIRLIINDTEIVQNYIFLKEMYKCSDRLLFRLRIILVLVDTVPLEPKYKTETTYFTLYLEPFFTDIDALIVDLLLIMFLIGFEYDDQVNNSLSYG